MSRIWMKRYSGVTLVEVMAAALVVLVVAIGMMNYQYACSMNARTADIRATASRLALVLLERWKDIAGNIDPSVFEPDDPLMGCGLGLAPLDYYDEVTDIGALPALGTQFKCYWVRLNGVVYWVKLTYNDQLSPPIRLLQASVAWSDDLLDEDALSYDPRRRIRLSKYTTIVAE